MFHLRSTVTRSVEAEFGNIFEIKKNFKALWNQSVQLQIPGPEMVKRFYADCGWPPLEALQEMSISCKMELGFTGFGFYFQL